MTEVFALLTCYIRLLHLHSLLYARITEILTSFSQGSSSSSSTPSQEGSSTAAQGCPLGHSSTSNSSLGTTSASHGEVVVGTSSQNNIAPPPPLFPGLCLDGVCLDDFAKFQIKFLLQITTHTLGEIEGVLGLPEGCRISRRDSNSAFNTSTTANGKTGRGRQRQRGILEGGCVSKGFIEMTMGERGLNMESFAGGGDGPAAATARARGTGIGGGDRLTCIRDYLVELRKLLKGTINP